MHQAWPLQVCAGGVGCGDCWRGVEGRFRHGQRVKHAHAHSLTISIQPRTTHVLFRIHPPVLRIACMGSAVLRDLGVTADASSPFLLPIVLYFTALRCFAADSDRVRLSARFPWFVSQMDAEDEGEREVAGGSPTSESDSAVAGGDWEIRDPTAALQLVVHWTRPGEQGWGAGGAAPTPRDPPVPCVVMVNASTTVREATALCVRCVPLLPGAALCRLIGFLVQLSLSCRRRRCCLLLVACCCCVLLGSWCCFCRCLHVSGGGSGVVSRFLVARCDSHVIQSFVCPAIGLHLLALASG